MIDCRVSGQVVSLFDNGRGSVNVGVSRGDKHYDTVFNVPKDLVKQGDEVSFSVRLRRYFKDEKHYGYFFIFDRLSDTEKTK